MIESVIITPIIGALGGLASQWFARDAKKLEIQDKQNERLHALEMTKIQHAQALELTRV